MSDDSVLPICRALAAHLRDELARTRSSFCSTPTTARARPAVDGVQGSRQAERDDEARHALLQRLHRRPVPLGQRPGERPRARAEDQRGFPLLRRARRTGDGQPHPPAAGPLRRLRFPNRHGRNGKSSFSREVRERGQGRDGTTTSRSRAARRTSSSGASSSRSCSSCLTGPRPTSG